MWNSIYPSVIIVEIPTRMTTYIIRAHVYIVCYLLMIRKEKVFIDSRISAGSVTNRQLHECLLPKKRERKKIVK